jgi:hypothetical protein
VLFDAASLKSQCAGGAKDSMTITSVQVGSQANRILVVTVGAEDDTADCNLGLSQTSVTYGNRALTRAVSAVSGAVGWRTCSAVFYLLNPPTGNANVTVNFPKTVAGSIDNRHGAAFVVYQAAQAAPVTAGAGAEATTNPVFTALDVGVAGALVVDVITQGERGSFTAQSVGQIERWDRSCSSSNSAGSTVSVTSPGVVQLGWRHTLPRRYAHSLAAFRPAP